MSELERLREQVDERSRSLAALHDRVERLEREVAAEEKERDEVRDALAEAMSSRTEPRTAFERSLIVTSIALFFLPIPVAMIGCLLVVVRGEYGEPTGYEGVGTVMREGGELPIATTCTFRIDVAEQRCPLTVTCAGAEATALAPGCRFETRQRTDNEGEEVDYDALILDDLQVSYDEDDLWMRLPTTMLAVHEVERTFD